MVTNLALRQEKRSKLPRVLRCPPFQSQNAVLLLSSVAFSCEAQRTLVESTKLWSRSEFSLGGKSQTHLLIRTKSEPEKPTKSLQVLTNRTNGSDQIQQQQHPSQFTETHLYVTAFRMMQVRCCWRGGATLLEKAGVSKRKSCCCVRLKAEAQSCCLCVCGCVAAQIQEQS